MSSTHFGFETVDEREKASRVRGVDAIFGGHTHDGVPVAVPVKGLPA